MDSRRSPTPAAKPASVARPAPAATAARQVRPGEAAEDKGPTHQQVERVIQHLERALEELRTEYEKFFSGAVKLPPEGSRVAIQRDLRLLRAQNLRGTAEQFRLAALEARFNSFSEMFNRRVRDHEEGRGSARTLPPPPRPRFDPAAGVVLAGAPDRDEVGAMLEELRRRGGGAGLDVDRFASYLEQQASSIRARTGCDAVQFRLAEEDGKVKLKARPLPGSTA